VPAQVVRLSFDFVEDTYNVFQIFATTSLSEHFYHLFKGGVVVCGLLIILMALLRGLFLFFMRQTIIVMSRLIEYDQKNDIFQHYQKLSLGFYRRNNTGDLMARISEDVSKVRMYTGPAIMYGINLVVLFILVISYMVSVNAMLTFYVLLPLPILSISIYYVNEIIERRSTEIQQSLSRISSIVQEAFSGVRVLKAYGREPESVRHFSKESKIYQQKSIQLNHVNSLFLPLMQALIGLSTILVIYVGGISVMDGSISTGNIAEFIIYVNMLTWPVTSLGWVISIAQRAAASQKRINEFLNTVPDIDTSAGVQAEIKGDVRFSNVSLTYPDTGIQALKNITFEVKAGESIAVLGATGSGKTTLANLICRLYEPQSGEIFIDNKPIKYYQPRHLRTQMAYVPQDVFLFSDSIANNIAFGGRNTDFKNVEQAAKAADLHDNIMNFPARYDTVLGERGITLSGGQKQRVSIARALILEPKILILDDCLSAVDTKTEHTILDKLKQIMQGKTTFIISHRISSAKLADKVLVLDKGEIVGFDTHEKLYAENAIYRELYDKQSNLEEV
jgi:ATP-binding cassette subfamily B protein